MSVMKLETVVALSCLGKTSRKDEKYAVILAESNLKESIKGQTEPGAEP